MRELVGAYGPRPPNRTAFAARSKAPTPLQIVADCPSVQVYESPRKSAVIASGTCRCLSVDQAADPHVLHGARVCVHLLDCQRGFDDRGRAASLPYHAQVWL